MNNQIFIYFSSEMMISKEDKLTFSSGPSLPAIINLHFPPEKPEKS